MLTCCGRTARKRAHSGPVPAARSPRTLLDVNYPRQVKKRLNYFMQNITSGLWVVYCHKFGFEHVVFFIQNMAVTV